MALSKTVEKNLGTVLAQSGMISSEQWQGVLDLHQETGKDISHILIEEELVTEQELAMVAGLQHNVPCIDLRQIAIDPAALKLIPESMARLHNAIPIQLEGDVLTVAMEDPWNIHAMEDMAAQSRLTIRQVEASPADVRRAIDANYKAGSEVEKEFSDISKSAGDEQRRKKEEAERISSDTIAETPVVRAVDMIIEQAVKDRTSDVHIMAEEGEVRVRYRIDGILHDAMKLPLSVHLPLISRLKIMAGMNIADRRRPQDGQFSMKLGDKKIDVRVATSDTVNGEMVVMRVLDKSFALLDLTELGFLPEALDKYKRMLGSPFGMILLSGPTGSGKTTTLYASVNQLNKDERNIMTIEDPVEYRFSGINQVQVNPAAGMTFASGLRALMRLDPDVILVGEIRDRETAEIAVQASLTGHLVLSSIHANDTVGAVFRLMDLGIEPFLISSSLLGVVAQRMIRRVCIQCGKPRKATEEEGLIYERELGEKRNQFHYGKGCNACANTGYRGRCGVYEILEMTEGSRRLLLAGAGAEEIRAKATEEGMMSMWRDGMLKVKENITTPYELLRNVYSIS